MSDCLEKFAAVAQAFQTVRINNNEAGEDARPTNLS